MKRDYQLCKEILLQVEEKGTWDDVVDLDLPGHAPEFVSYQIKLMVQAGLLEADSPGTEVPDWYAKSLTYQGHEFLDSIRNDSVWAKVTQKVKEKGGGVAFEVLKTMAIEFSKAHFLGGAG